MGWGAAYIASEWAIRVAALLYLTPRMHPAAARGWLLLIFMLPWPGAALYFLIGRRTLPRSRADLQAAFAARLRQAQALPMIAAVEVTPTIPAALGSVPTLTRALGLFPVLGDNDVQLLDDYDGAHDALVLDIDQAREHVHIETYIFAADAVGARVQEALGAAVGRGVRCRVLMDKVGSGRTARKVVAELRARGVEAHLCMPASVLAPAHERYDLRNHRKIVVIDGRIGYVGSQNIVRADVWAGHPNVELVARITGPVVRALQSLFLADRTVETHTTLNDADLFPPPDPAGSAPAQLLPSSPSYSSLTTLEVLTAAIYGARSRVVLATPYFIPPEPLSQAMVSAAHGGVAVNLIVPRWGNSRPEALAQHSYYDELLEAGVRIHRVWPAFLHSKHVSVDDSIAVIGSSNLDVRSFLLNAEAVVLIYDRTVVERLRTVEARYLEHAEELSLEAWRERSWPQRVGESVFRLMNTLL